MRCKCIKNVFSFIVATGITSLYILLIYNRVDILYLLILTAGLVSCVCLIRGMLYNSPATVYEDRVVVQYPVFQNPVSFIVIQQPENNISIGYPIVFIRNPMQV
jgi:hypothetical protein